MEKLAISTTHTVASSSLDEPLQKLIARWAFIKAHVANADLLLAAEIEKRKKQLAELQVLEVDRDELNRLLAEYEQVERLLAEYVQEQQLQPQQQSQIDLNNKVEENQVSSGEWIRNFLETFWDSVE